MFHGIRRRRKQQRPQHSADLASESKASFSSMNDRGHGSEQSTAAGEDLVSGGQLGMQDDESETSSDYDDDVVTPEHRQSSSGVIVRSDSPPFRPKPGSIPNLLRRSSTLGIEPGICSSRSEKKAATESRPVVLLESWPPPVDERRNDSRSRFVALYDDRGSCRSSTGSPRSTGSGVIGNESHVTKLQSFVDSLANQTRPNGYQGSSALLASRSPFRLLPRLKSLSAAPHHPGSNSGRPYSSGLRSAAAAAAAAAEAEEEEPLDLSTKGSSVTASGFKDPDAATPVEIQKREIFERLRRSQVENLGRFRFHSQAIRQNDDARLDSKETDKSVASLAPTYVRDRTRTIEMRDKREKMMMMMMMMPFEELRVDVTSHEVRPDSFAAAELADGEKRRLLRGLRPGSQENANRKRKFTHHTEGILKIERRKARCLSSHQSSKHSNHSGFRRPDGSDLNQTEAAPDKTKTAELLRAKCTCGRGFESLYQLAVHIQQSGHVLENRKPVSTDDSAKPVYGQRAAWTLEVVQRQTESSMKSIRCSSPCSSPTQAMFASHSSDVASENDRCAGQRSDFGAALVESARADRKDPEDGKSVDGKPISPSDLNRRGSVAARGYREFRRDWPSSSREPEFKSAAGVVSSRYQSNSKDETTLKEEEASTEDASESARDEAAPDCYHLQSGDDDDNNEEQMETVVKITPTEEEDEAETEHCIPHFSAHDLTDEVNRKNIQSPRLESVPKQSPSILSAEIAAEHRLTGTSGTVCTSRQSNDPSVTEASDYPRSAASREKSPAIKRHERRREIKSRDRLSDDERNPIGFGDKNQLRKRRFTNGGLPKNGTTGDRSENNSETTKVISTTCIASDSATSDDRSVSKRKHERNGVNPETQEKERSSCSNLLQRKRYSPDDRNCAETTRQEIARNFEAQSLFVSPPSSNDVVDSSLSLVAMKNFVDKHFSDQDNYRLFTKVNVLSPRNYNRTTHDTRRVVMTVGRTSTKSSSAHRKSPSTKRLDVLFATKTLLPSSPCTSSSGGGGYSQDNSHEVLDRPSVSSSASSRPAKGRRSEERTGHEPESTVGDVEQLESSESFKSRTFEASSSSSRSVQQNPFTDRPTIGGGPRNGVTAVHAESGTTGGGGVARSTPGRETEAEDAAAANSADVNSAHLKKSSPLKFKAKSLPPTETASLSPSPSSSSSSSSISFSLTPSSYSKVDIGGAVHATAPSSINHFRCCTESLEQVC